jgi:hypothetical protein
VLVSHDKILGLAERSCPDGARGTRGAMSCVMNAFEKAASAEFTPIERAYIRGQLDQFFSTLPTVAEGFQLKVWRGGPQAREPKLPPAAKSLVGRGLMRLDATAWLPRLFFTKLGLTALRTMMADRRLADPAKFAHVRQELGMDPIPTRNQESQDSGSIFAGDARRCRSDPG